MKTIKKWSKPTLWALALVGGITLSGIAGGLLGNKLGESIVEALEM